MLDVLLEFCEGKARDFEAIPPFCFRYADRLLALIRTVFFEKTDHLLFRIRQRLWVRQLFYGCWHRFD